MRKPQILIVIIYFFIIGCKKELPLTTKDSYRQCNSMTAPELNTKGKTNKSNSNKTVNLKESHYQDSVEYYNLLGSQLIYSQEYQNAINILKRACFLDSSISYSFYNLAIAQSELGYFDKAIETINLAEKLCPEKLGILNNKGYSLLELKQYQESEKYLLKAREKDINDKKVIGNLLVLYDRQKDTNKVVELLSFIDNNKLIDTTQSKLLRSLVIKYNYEIKAITK